MRFAPLALLLCLTFVHTACPPDDDDDPTLAVDVTATDAADGFVTPDADAGTISDASLCTGNYVCGDCTSDVAATCGDSGWVCPGDATAVESCADETTCSEWGGEVCCDANGTSTPALCPSPSQAYCPDGSTPQFSCAAPDASNSSDTGAADVSDTEVGPDA